MKKRTCVILTIITFAMLTFSSSMLNLFAEDDEKLQEVEVTPRGPVYQNILIVDFCDGTYTHAFYGNYSTKYPLTNIAHPISIESWSSDLGLHYKYKYIDSQEYEHVPFDDGYTYTENRYVGRKCGYYGQ